MNYIKFFSDISLKDLALVGGKNASLGEMIQQLQSLSKDATIKVPLGFAITTKAYWEHLSSNKLEEPIKELLNNLTDNESLVTLEKVGQAIRTLIYDAPLPEKVVDEISHAYTELSNLYNENDLDVAIRSSATAEDLPHASFAGQQDTYLNIGSIEDVLDSVKKCMASLFTNRAIVYRIEQGFDHFKIGISVGVQKMVRSDLASSGVIFSLDTDTGFKDVIIITSSYGLGENIVKGVVNPDEFHVHKPTLALGFRPILRKSVGSKELKLIYTQEGTKRTLENVKVDPQDQRQFSVSDDDILELARQTLVIEEHYSKLKGSWCPMDIEWAKDGIDHQLYIVQARPETIHSLKKWEDVIIRYHLKEEAHKKVIVTGLSIGQKIAHGTARILQSIHDHATFNEGDILVASMTDPDWVPLMKKASAIITDKGGRTCHAAIVSRELGIPAVIGTSYATELIKDGQPITIDCSKSSVGYVYEGLLDFEIYKTELKKLSKPRVPVMLNIANPDRAYKLSSLPVSGVGLARVEFIITSYIKVHPMAVCAPEKITDKKIVEQIEKLAGPYKNPKNFFVETLAQGIAIIAAAFYPREVVVRLSDFKTNEYRNLIAGSYFEPIEENPMLGFRGAIRYCDEKYAPAFALECEALKIVRNQMGLTNVKILIPFVRNLYEASCTLAALAQHGIQRGENGLQILMMCEIPSNVILLEEFSQFFDGFSIGSNDLTQFTLAVDRDSTALTPLFNEKDPAVKKMFKIALDEANRLKIPISICGQAPSDFPEIADFLIENGITALSLNADSVIPFLLKEPQ